MRARLQAVSARVALEQQKREGAKVAVLADAQGAARVRAHRAYKALARLLGGAAAALAWLAGAPGMAAGFMLAGGTT